jgi:twitching motility protein PilT
MARLDSFLRLVVEQHASDLHLHAGTVPLIRHDGDLVPLNFRTLTETDVRRFLLEVLTPEQRERFAAQQELDLIYEIPESGRFRCNLFQQARGMGAVFRIIPHRLPTLEELALPASVRRLTQMQNGLVIISGPTGSGKSTTLAAIVHEINRTSSRHVITIEDPIEFVHQPLQGVVTQRQVGKHVESFEAALRSSLRESPDVVVTGEMRDMETIHTALQAAETGVLVFGTLHTNSAAKAADRIIDVFPDQGREQVRGIVSVLLKGVIAQHLVKRAAGDGRIAVMEVLLQNVGVANLIREGKTHQIDGYLQAVEAGSGMQSLDACIFRYVKDGVIALKDGLKVANYPDQLRKMAAEIPDDDA